MMLKLTASVLLATIAVPAAAQTMPDPSVGTNPVPADLAVPVLLDSEVSSKRMRVGDRFGVTVARDIVQNGRIVVPRGARGSGVVTWRSGRGAFGRSAKMEIAVTTLSLGNRLVPMAGRFREQGDGNTAATVGTIIVGGLVAGALVTGHSAVFEQGRELSAFVAASMNIAMTPDIWSAAAAPAGSWVPLALADYRPPSAAPIAADIFARRLAAARPVSGGEATQGWTIGD